MNLTSLLLFLITWHTSSSARVFLFPLFFVFFWFRKQFKKVSAELHLRLYLLTANENCLEKKINLAGLFESLIIDLHNSKIICIFFMIIYLRWVLFEVWFRNWVFIVNKCISFTMSVMVFWQPSFETFVVQSFRFLA